MTVNKVDKSIIIAVPPAEVYAEISEPNNLLGLQPLVVEVSPVSRSQDSEGNTVLTYQSVELFRLGGIVPYRNAIQVESTLFPEQWRMLSRVKSPLNIQLEFAYQIKAAGQGTQLDLNINFTAPSLIREFVLSQVNTAQDAVLVNLKTRLEARR